jgi:hypothetical protein
MKEDSHTALSKLISRGEKFDFIYCSGSRKPYVCYVDFALLSKVVNDDSMMLLDEYSAWSSYEGDISPDKVRDIFIESFKRQVDVIPVGLQKLVKFKKVALDDWVAREKPADCVEI